MGSEEARAKRDSRSLLTCATHLFSASCTQVQGKEQIHHFTVSINQPVITHYIIVVPFPLPRLSQVIEQFLEMLDVRDDLSHIVIRKLLQTAICASNMESPKDVAKILGVDAASLNSGEDAGSGGRGGDGVSSTSSKPSPTVSEVSWVV